MGYKSKFSGEQVEAILTAFDNLFYVMPEDLAHKITNYETLSAEEGDTLSAALSEQSNSCKSLVIMNNTFSQKKMYELYFVGSSTFLGEQIDLMKMYPEDAEGSVGGWHYMGYRLTKGSNGVWSPEFIGYD